MANVTPTSQAGESLKELSQALERNAGFLDAIEALSKSEPAIFDGVWGSACALLSSAVAKHAPSTTLVICQDANRADHLLQDLETFYSAESASFATLEVDQQHGLGGDREYGQRLRLLKAIVSGRPPRVIVASIQSLLQRVPTPDAIATHSMRFEVGQAIDLEGIQRWLVENKYHATSAVELPGEFSLRGGILDLFALDWESPVRIELFDDEVESIRRFDIQSQRSIESLTELELTVLSRTEDVDCFTTFLPSDTWVLHVEPSDTKKAAEHYLSLSDSPENHESYTGVLSRLNGFAQGTVASLVEGKLGTTYRARIESVERFSGDLDAIRKELDRVGQGHRVFVVASVMGEIERLQEILGSTKLAARGDLRIPCGCVHEGFRLVDDQTIVISGDQLFQRGQLRRTTSSRHLGKAIDSFLDLREGDLVVHLAHGIGRYRGLKLLTKDDHTEEHLEIEFAEKTKIYVPATKIDLVQKYIGGTKTRPRLAKIGGKLWVRQKQSAESAVTDMASEMLELQASRSSRTGIVYSQDTKWQHEFENSFPYHETPDQLTAIASIKNDMQTNKPMDRLLCGDVGFGKTEVSMRAVFKAVENGYQVAVLVPTTVLAEQHYRTFTERMAEFPLDIGKLSRFCSTQEMKETLAGLKTGRVDIVIGTHRLASRDVEFYNLGLLVIDEEQRFGVEVKERLKTVSAQVDVLAMSATPIPRTLHMSLVGVRDISNLETAPEERVAVETRVTRFDEELIKSAVHRELNRGGQIYFVHNRVGDIHALKARLQYIVPEASIEIGHGQMAEGELEKVMTGFINHKFDILLATTIVESGLDIPNANTIFIDEAERYGLSDLHQLRGRVGRYKHRAYCYLMIDPKKHLNPSAAKRLRAIEEFSEMGAGFQISMRDLEIRGAGNLLGTEQSGHIATVGYELYCQMLETAVRALKNMPARLSIDIDIDLPVKAFLPDDYISDKRQKIDLYRRMTRLERYDQIEEFRAELIDRFGAMPTVVEKLLEFTELKLDAAVWQIQAISLEDHFLVFRYSDRARIDQLCRQYKGRLRVVDGENAYVTLKKGISRPEVYLDLAKSILRPSE